MTESLLASDIEDISTKMKALKAHGVGFSLDDFGTGYSSLSHLKRLPLDQLKIDQSFVRDLMTDPNDAAIALAVITLGHSLGLAVIAKALKPRISAITSTRKGAMPIRDICWVAPYPFLILNSYFFRPLLHDRLFCSTASDFGFAHQPILNSHRVVVGYELFDRSHTPQDVTQHHTAASDAQLLFNVLQHPRSSIPIGDKTLFINCTHDSRAGGHLELVAPERSSGNTGTGRFQRRSNRNPPAPTTGYSKAGFRLAFDHAVLTRSVCRLARAGVVYQV